MTARSNSDLKPDALLALAVTEAYPESSYGAIPTEDQIMALEAFLAFDQGVFAEAPLALEAYLDSQRRTVA